MVGARQNVAQEFVKEKICQSKSSQRVLRPKIIRVNPVPLHHLKSDSSTTSTTSEEVFTSLSQEKRKIHVTSNLEMSPF